MSFLLVKVPVRVPLAGEELKAYRDEENRKRRLEAEEEEQRRQAAAMEKEQVCEPATSDSSSSTSIVWTARSGGLPWRLAVDRLSYYSFSREGIMHKRELLLRYLFLMYR